MYMQMTAMVFSLIGGASILMSVQLSAMRELHPSLCSETPQRAGIRDAPLLLCRMFGSSHCHVTFSLSRPSSRFTECILSPACLCWHCYCETRAWTCTPRAYRTAALGRRLRTPLCARSIGCDCTRHSRNIPHLPCNV